MITDLTLLKMPFTDGVPEDVEQKRIDWIKNGDKLTAASTKYGSDGRLNSAAYGINKNVETNTANDILIAAKINELTDGVNNINSALEVSSDADIVKQIGINKTNIETLQTSTAKTEDDVETLQINADHTSEDIGVFNPELDSVYRTLRGDLLWIKTEMGKYPAQDINGLTVIDGPASGMKARIMSNTDQLVKTTNRLTDLEQKVTDSDVGTLTNNVAIIRTELGPTSLATQRNVYQRLNDGETDIASVKLDAASVKVAIGFTNSKTINTRVTDLETSNTKVTTTLYSDDGVVNSLEKLTVEVGSTSDPLSLTGKVATNQNDITSIYAIIGKDTSSGMRSDIAWINQQIGVTQEGGNPTPGSILNRLDVLTANGNQIASTVQDVQSEIGNNTEGLKGSVNTLSTQMNGTGASTTTIEGVGVFNFSKSLSTKIETKIDEAPNDGRVYARKSKAWVSRPSSVARFVKDTYTFDLSGGSSNVPFASLTASALNSGLTVGSTSLTIVDAGVFNIKLLAEVSTVTQNVKFEVKVNGTTVFSNDPLVATLFTSGAVVRVDDIVKLAVNDVITIAVSSVAGDTNVVLNNLKITLTPTA
ncbi:fibritin neck whisker [Erwinia phage Cronus]|uniref:Fibritin neck whiskers protein n=1 Tax=Erwinia phage Cronus TaxID=2163633 RepID=A0A2S1GLQ3_9CAUD|nr:fibritin neck whisker [Erwinia phage Cronus]AWD90309.1 fibritin neck whiskers protein [Erwinia phage Cronus]